MKRMHINLAVDDLDASVRFYSGLFAAPPTVLKHDYAKWMLDDPRVNFSLSTHGESRGIDHLGLQAEDDKELLEIYQRLTQAGGPVVEQRGAQCCYAQSDKRWIADPDGVRWETFLTRGEVPVYGADGAPAAGAARAASCCGPAR